MDTVKFGVVTLSLDEPCPSERMQMSCLSCTVNDNTFTIAFFFSLFARNSRTRTYPFRPPIHYLRGQSLLNSDACKNTEASCASSNLFAQPPSSPKWQSTKKANAGTASSFIRVFWGGYFYSDSPENSFSSRAP